MAITKLIDDGFGQKMVTTHRGRVLRVYQRDYRVMSDVYTLALFADVWSDNNKVESILVNANFECDQTMGTAEVDASKQILAIKLAFDLMNEREHEASRLKEEKALEKAHKEKEYNRPVKGKKMIVFKGRKVKPGTIGVVSYINDRGSVLLKDEKCWNDRNADGIWVNEKYLKAFEG